MMNMAILGFGTVGSGVAKVLTENASEVATGAGEEVREFCRLATEAKKRFFR